jgi:hypothetical protein
MSTCRAVNAAARADPSRGGGDARGPERRHRPHETAGLLLQAPGGRGALFDLPEAICDDAIATPSADWRTWPTLLTRRSFMRPGASTRAPQERGQR